MDTPPRNKQSCRARAATNLTRQHHIPGAGVGISGALAPLFQIPIPAASANGRARREGEESEKVGAAMLSGPDYAQCRTKIAVGAEMQTGTPCAAKGSGSFRLVEDRGVEPLASRMPF